VIDIVRADDRADEFLEQVVLLVGAPGRGQSADGVGTVLLFDGAEAIGNIPERLIP